MNDINKIENATETTPSVADVTSEKETCENSGGLLKGLFFSVTLVVATVAAFVVPTVMIGTADYDSMFGIFDVYFDASAAGVFIWGVCMFAGYKIYNWIFG